MARKGMQLDAAMLSDMHAVGADSFKDKISMIHVEKIKPSLDNFYAIKDIEILAEDIERQGLKHNLVVTEDANNPDTYFIKSGHRRFEAIKLLIKMNLYTSNYVPCLVDGAKTKSENMLDLIMLNATTRVMTDAELYRQYEVLRETLEQLKEEGKKIKGRLRENVAAFLKISPAQVGKIENIKHNAEPEVQAAVENGELSIATANDIARLPDEQQRELIAENNLSEITSAEVKKYQPVKEDIHTDDPDEDDPDEDDPDEDDPDEDDSDEDDPDEDDPDEDDPDEDDPDEDDPDEDDSDEDDSDEDDSDEDDPDADDLDEDDPDEGDPDADDLDEDESEHEYSEETHCEHYRAALLDSIQKFTHTINAATNMKSIDRAIVRMQSELRKIMEEI